MTCLGKESKQKIINNGERERESRERRGRVYLTDMVEEKKVTRVTAK